MSLFIGIDISEPSPYSNASVLNAENLNFDHKFTWFENPGESERDVFSKSGKWAITLLN